MVPRPYSVGITTKVLQKLWQKKQPVTMALQMKTEEWILKFNDLTSLLPMDLNILNGKPVTELSVK